MAEEWRVRFPVHGQLTPVDMRVPGYPAFLAAVFAVAGQSPRAAMLAQVVVDLATCFVIALIAARLAPENSRRRVALAGLWLAALCPFTANYTAVVLTETLVIFLTALAILVLLQTDVGGAGDIGAALRRLLANPWLLAGIVVGFGTLVRPETPLLLFAAGLVLLAKWWRPADWMKLVRAGVLMALGCCCRWCRGPRATGTRCTKCSFSRRATANCPANTRRWDSTRGRTHGSGDSATCT